MSLSTIHNATTRCLVALAAIGCLLLPSLAAGSEPPIVIPVTVALDGGFRADPTWSQSVGRAFAGANERIGAPFRILFKVDRRTAWAPAGPNLDAYLGRLREQIGPRPGGIVIGLTRDRPEPSHVFGATDYVDALTVLSVPFGSGPWDRELAHELGHVLGAVDVEGDDELMAGQGHGLHLDPMNARLMELHRARRFPPSRFPLEGAQLDATERLYREAGVAALAAGHHKSPALEPRRAQALHDLALVAARNGRREEAVAMYRRALQLEPDYAPALADLAPLLLETGKTEEALNCARRAAALGAPIAPDLLRALGQTAAGENTASAR